MRKIILRLFLIFIIAVSIFAEEKLKNTYYKNGKIEEEYLYDKDGDVIRNKFGIPLSNWYYENGNIGGNHYYNNDGVPVRDFFDSDGKINRRDTYSKNYNDFDYVTSSKDFKDFNYVTSQTYFYESGKVKRVEIVLEPEEGGYLTVLSFAEYYESGKIKEEKFEKSKDDKIINISYYESGKIKSKSFEESEDGKIIKTSYYGSGTIEEEVFYDNEKTNKTDFVVLKKYYKSEKVKSIITMSRNLEKEIFQAKETGYYENGKLKSKRTITSKGEISYTGDTFYPWAGYEDSAVEYFPSGKILSKRYKKNGPIESEFLPNKEEFLKYLENGTLIFSDLYLGQDDEFNVISKGVRKTFYNSGKIKTEMEYGFDFGDGDSVIEKKNGTYKEYSEDGKITKKEVYNYGKLIKKIK